MFQIIGVTLAAHVFASDGLNNSIKYISPIYTIFAILIIVYFHKNKEDISIPKEKKVYELAKGPPNWKRAFAGTWEMQNRVGMKELAIFLGKSNFVAGMADKQPFTNFIYFKDSTNEDCLKMDTKGVPAQEGVWCIIGGEGVETSQEGKAVIESQTWNEEKKSHCRMRESKEGKLIYIFI